MVATPREMDGVFCGLEGGYGGFRGCRFRLFLQMVADRQSGSRTAQTQVAGSRVLSQWFGKPFSLFRLLGGACCPSYCRLRLKGWTWLGRDWSEG